MQRLAIRDVAAVLIFFLDLAADVHVRRVLGELKNVRPEKTNPAFNGGLQAPMAVITEITEKTPIVMPIIVSSSAQFIRA
jgi:hypothetical protein